MKWALNCFAWAILNLLVLGIAGREYSCAEDTPQSNSSRDDAEEKIEKSTFKIKLVDENDQPISGVVVTPRLLHNFKLKVYSHWKPKLHGKIVPAITSDQGTAELVVPKSIETDVETLYVGCEIDHPEFIRSAQLPMMNGQWHLLLGGSISKSVLLRGETAEITARLGPKQQPVADFHVMASSQILYNARDQLFLRSYRQYDLQWKKAGAGTLVSKRIPPGTTFFSSRSYPGERPNLF